MPIRLCPSLLASLVVVTSTAAGGQIASAPPAGEREAIVPIYLSSGRALIMLRSGDRTPIPMVFDTGSDENIIARPDAAAMQLAEDGTTQVIDGATGNAATAPVVIFPNARVGDAELGDLRAAMLDRREDDAVGVFSPDNFRGRLVYVELGKGRLRLRPGPGGPLSGSAASPYLDGLPAVRIEIQGIAVTAHLDSGNDSALILPRALIGRLALYAPPTVVGRAISALGEQDVYGGRIRGDVRIGPVTLHDPEVTFSQGANANVGLPVIRQLTIVLDPDHRRDWLVKPAPLGPAALGAYAGRYGLRTIRVERAALVYQRDGRSPMRLLSLGEDLFENPANGDRIQFVRSGARIIGLDLITGDGAVASADRN